MELTATLIAVIIITSLVSSALSIAAKLIYDGIKVKKNGSNGNNRHISMDLALLAKDINFNNLKLIEVENNLNRLVELSIAFREQINTFKALISSLTTAINKLESKL